MATYCTALKVLQLEDCPGVTDEVLRLIAKHNTTIHTLTLRPSEIWSQFVPITRVSDSGIEAIVLARKNSLRALSLSEGTTDRSIRLVVENCPRLRKLDLLSSRITDDGCNPLLQLRDIKGLRIGDTAKGTLPSSNSNRYSFDPFHNSIQGDGVHTLASIEGEFEDGEDSKPSWFLGREGGDWQIG